MLTVLLPSLSDCYDQSNSKQTSRAHYKVFPRAKEEKPPQEMDSTRIFIINIITTEHFGRLVLFAKLSSAGLLEKSSICPQLSARKHNSNPSSGTKVLPRSLACCRHAERVARQRQPDWGLRLTRDAPASTNNSCHVDRTVQGNGKLLQAFS